MLTCISIHAAREGGDAITQLPRIYRSKFQSTPPVKAATHAINKCRYGNRISIHAAREGGDCAYRRCRTQHHISIHAAREGGDSGRGIVEWDEVISIHAAREGGDTTFSTSSSVRPSFQSTPPVKAATSR